MLILCLTIQLDDCGSCGAESRRKPEGRHHALGSYLRMTILRLGGFTDLTCMQQENRMCIGNKKIYHLEAWVVKVMSLYKVSLHQSVIILLLIGLGNSNSFWGSNLVILTTSFNFALLSLHLLYYLPPRNFEQHGANVIVIGEDF